MAHTPYKYHPARPAPAEAEQSALPPEIIEAARRGWRLHHEVQI
jgi:hypothetical protein